VVLMFPRYLMIAGITVLALTLCMPQIQAMDKPDFEKVLPIVLQFIPTGVVGFLLAGLAAAFMSNFAATLNAAPAYVVNDIYKRFINANAGAKREVMLSRLFAFVFLAIGAGWRYWIPKDTSGWIASQCLWVENADTIPWRLGEVFHYLLFSESRRLNLCFKLNNYFFPLQYCIRSSLFFIPKDLK